MDDSEQLETAESLIEPTTTSRRGLIMGLGGFIVAGTAGFFLLDASSKEDQNGFPSIDVENPDGTRSSLADLAGTPLVLNFFASWCAPCRAEMPDLEAVAQEVSGRVRFFGLAIPPSTDEAATMVAETGVTYDWAIDTQSEALAHFEGAAMPTTVFIRANGSISENHSGILNADDIRAQVARLL